MEKPNNLQKFIHACDASGPANSPETFTSALCEVILDTCYKKDHNDTVRFRAGKTGQSIANSKTNVWMLRDLHWEKNGVNPPQKR
jgi:hypothetical protein